MTTCILYLGIESNVLIIMLMNPVTISKKMQIFYYLALQGLCKLI